MKRIYCEAKITGPNWSATELHRVPSCWHVLSEPVGEIRSPPVRVRFQADNDLRGAIVRGAIRIDFRTAHAARLDGVSDPDVLAIAAEGGRILVSHDFETMPRHFRRFTGTRRSPGIFLISQDLPVGDAIESLLLIWEFSESDEWENRLCLIPSLVTIGIGAARPTTIE